MSVLKVSHQRESLPLHPVTPGPQAGNVVTAQRTVDGYRVVLHLLGSLEGLHTARPLAHEGLLSIDLYGGRRGGARSGRRGR